MFHIDKIDFVIKLNTWYMYRDLGLQDIALITSKHTPQPLMLTHIANAKALSKEHSPLSGRPYTPM